MKLIIIPETVKLLISLTDIVYVPHTDQEYNRLVNLLDDLIDEIGEDESHLLASMMEITGVLIENYETNHVPELADG